MRIAIDVRKINEFGVGSYIWNLVRNIAILDQTNEFRLLGSSRNFHELGPLPANFKHIQIEEGQTLTDRWYYPGRTARTGAELFHIPHQEPDFPLPSRFLVTVHDCARLKFPVDGEAPLRHWMTYQRTARMIRRARHVLKIGRAHV